jgi:hypothetical protein
MKNPPDPEAVTRIAGIAKIAGGGRKMKIEAYSLADLVGQSLALLEAAQESGGADILQALGDGCHGLEITPSEAREALDAEDVEAFRRGEISAQAVRLFCLALDDKRLRRRGEVPARYTTDGHCLVCGPVYLPESWPQAVTSCPWCVNRREGLPIHRPEALPCSGCIHFRRDTIGSGQGLGDCAIQEGERRGWALWPDKERYCKRWLPTGAA